MRRIRENFPVIQAVTKMASSIDLSNERKAIDHLKEIGKGYVEALNSEGYDFVFYDKTLKASEKRLIFTMETNRDPLHVELTHNWKTGEVKWVVFRGWKTFGKGKADVKKVVDEVHKVLAKNKDKIMAEDYSLNELTFDQFFQKYPFSAPASGVVGGIDKKNALYNVNGLLKAFNTKDKGLNPTEKEWFQKLIKAKFNFQDFADMFDNESDTDINIFIAEDIDQNMFKTFLALVDYTPAKLKKEVKAWFDDKEEFEDMWEAGYIIPDYMEEKPKLRKLLYFINNLFAFLIDNNYINREELNNYYDDDWDDDDTFDSYWFERWNKMFKLKPEPNTKYEDDFLEKIRSWFEESDAQTANYLKNIFPILKQARQKYPAIFKPNVPENSPVYRGVKNLPSSVWTYMKKTEESDWSDTVMLSGRKWRILKQQIQYTPHNEAQSWSVSSKTAAGFANTDKGVILISQIDESFILNPSSSEALGNYEYSEEEEVIHIGKKFNSMRIAILESKWNEIRGNKPTSSGSFDDVASDAVGYKSAKKTTTKATAKKTTKKATKKVAKVAAPKPKKK